VIKILRRREGGKGGVKGVINKKGNEPGEPKERWAKIEIKRNAIQRPARKGDNRKRGLSRKRDPVARRTVKKLSKVR